VVEALDVNKEAPKLGLFIITVASARSLYGVSTMIFMKP
jgi:hypothetical protein